MKRLVYRVLRRLKFIEYWIVARLALTVLWFIKLLPAERSLAPDALVNAVSNFMCECVAARLDFTAHVRHRARRAHGNARQGVEGGAR